MSYAFTCSECGREMRTDERHIGRKVRCPGCATLLIIPAPDETVLDQPIGDSPPTAATTETAADDEIVELLPVEGPAAATSPIHRTEDRAEDLQVVMGPPDHLHPELAQTRLWSPPEAEVAPPEPPLPPSSRWKVRQRPAPKEPPAAPPPPAPKEPATTHTPLLRRRHRHPEDLIDMTAMVDIVFFLLIFFLVTSLQSVQAVMDMPTPQSASGASGKVRTVAEFQNDPNYIIVRIEDDDSIWVEDTQVFNEQDLGARLRAARQEGNRPKNLLVIGDADASHGAAVRVFDAGAAAGLDGISLLVQEKAESGS